MTMCAKYETAKMTSMNVVPLALPLKKEYFKTFFIKIDLFLLLN